MILIATALSGQENIGIKEGRVSYKNTQNVYVKFDNTDKLKIGDTLYVLLEEKQHPAFVIKHLSSISCVGINISNFDLKINDRLFSKRQEVSDSQKQEVIVKAREENLIEQNSEINKDVLEEVLPKSSINKQHINGRISLNSYSNQPSEGDNRTTRFRSTFSLTASNINNSRFSSEVYVIYRQKYIGGELINDPIQDPLKFYNLAFKYNLDKNSNILIGRKINPYISNLGAIDGIQAQKSMGSFLIGAIIGSRPDLQTYRYNGNMFEYGGYINHEHKTKKGSMHNTFALMEQKNTGKIDRRFSYFQHSNSLLKGLNLFASFELDLYKVVDDKPINRISLSSAYISLRYKASKKISFSASYDARNNVIYYESYKNFIDRLIDEETRQGLRFRVNIRPMKYVTMGSSVGYRYQNSTLKPSKNLYSYISISRIPFINVSTSISSTLLRTNYLDGQLFGIRLNKSFFQSKLFGELNFRKVKYKYARTETTLNQTIGGLNITWRMVRSLSLSIKYESIHEKDRNNSFVFVNIVKRI